MNTLMALHPRQVPSCVPAYIFTEEMIRISGIPDMEISWRPWLTTPSQQPLPDDMCAHQYDQQVNQVVANG